jgi:hypothetical protein
MDDLLRWTVGPALVVCWINGIYIAYQENFISFLISFVIMPWGVIKGFMGFF